MLAEYATQTTHMSISTTKSLLILSLFLIVASITATAQRGRYPNGRHDHDSRGRNYGNRPSNRPGGYHVQVQISPGRPYSSYDRYPRVYSYHRPTGYSYVRYNYAVPRRYVFVGAPRYSAIPRTFISINFGGYPYWYDGGYFYGYHNGYYEPVFAPRGIRIRTLPFGYRSFYHGPSLYFYVNGTFYQKHRDNNNEFEVVDAPVGAVIEALPQGADKVVVNGETFYELNGTYFKKEKDQDNRTLYEVVGKNGVIGNTQQHRSLNDIPNLPEVGDELTELPDGSERVTINGQSLYVTPDQLYLKRESVDQSVVYRVVGKTDKN